MKLKVGNYFKLLLFSALISNVLHAIKIPTEIIIILIAILTFSVIDYIIETPE